MAALSKAQRIVAAFGLLLAAVARFSLPSAIYLLLSILISLPSAYENLLLLTALAVAATALTAQVLFQLVLLSHGSYQDVTSPSEQATLRQLGMYELDTEWTTVLRLLLPDVVVLALTISLIKMANSSENQTNRVSLSVHASEDQENREASRSPAYMPVVQHDTDHVLDHTSQLAAAHSPSEERHEALHQADPDGHVPELSLNHTQDVDAETGTLRNRMTVSSALHHHALHAASVDDVHLNNEQSEDKVSSLDANQSYRPHLNERSTPSMSSDVTAREASSSVPQLSLVPVSMIWLALVLTTAVLYPSVLGSLHLVVAFVLTATLMHKGIVLKNTVRYVMNREQSAMMMIRKAAHVECALCIVHLIVFYLFQVCMTCVPVAMIDSSDVVSIV